MKRHNVILESNVEPKDNNVLWLQGNKLKKFGNTGWKDIGNEALALGALYGYFPDSSSLPTDATTPGYAYVGLGNPYKIWKFNGESWSDSGTSIDMNDADEEDLTRNTDGKLQFKDRVYGDGMGYVILRKDKTFAEQVTKENTIYEIRYKFDLEGEEIEIPANCVLNFNGGKIINGTIEHNNCTIISSTTCFEDIIFSSTYNKQINAMWFGVLPSNNSNASILNKLFTFCINIFLPIGVYNIEDELIFDGAIKQFHGSVDVSRALTKLNFSNTNGFVVKTRCSISNFVVHGNNCTGTYDSSQGIYLDGKLGIDVRKGCFIDNCVVSKFMVGLNIVSGHIITGRFNNIVVQENSNYGLCLVHTGAEQKNNLSFNLIYAANNGYDALNRESDSTLEASGIGIYIKGGYANSFTNCVCEYNSGVGLLVASPSGENILSGNLFSAIYTERNKYANIIIYVTNRAANEIFRNNVFKSLFYSDAKKAPVSNANENRGIIIKPFNLIVGKAYNAIYASFEINNISNKLIADYVSQMGVDIDLLGRMGITEDEDIIIKKDAKGYYIDLSSNKKTITRIGVLSLLKFKRGIYRIFVAAQSYNITSAKPSIYFGLTINGTLNGKTKQILSTEDFVTNLGVYYFSQENNDIAIDNSYITNVSSLPSNFNIRLRKIYFEEIKSLTSAERNSITLDSNMVGYRVFDSTLGKDVVWSGSKWIDAIGADI